MLRRIGFLRAENGTGLENPLKARRHRHLFIKLRTLRKVGVPAKIVYFEHVRAAFACRGNEFWRVDLDKSFPRQIFPHRCDQRRLCLEQQLVLLRPQVDPAVVQPHVQFRTRDGGLFLCGRDIFAVDRQRIGDGFHGDLIREYLYSAEMYVFIFTRDAAYENHGIRRQRRGGGDLRRLVFIYCDLHTTGHIAQNEEDHRLAFTHAADEARDQNLLIDMMIDFFDLYSFHGFFSFF